MSSTPSRTPSKLPSQKPAPSAAGSSAAPGMTSKVPGSSIMPSQLPSKLPSQSPSKMPSRMPSQSPSKMPSQSPSKLPSKMPSKMPSHAPSKMPSQSPSKFPSQSPSKLPSQSFGSRRPGDPTSTAPSGFGTKSLAGSSSSSSTMPPPPLPASFRTATPSEAMSTLKPSKQSVTPSLASTFQGVPAIPGPSSSSQIPGGRSMIPRPGGGVLASTWTSPDDLKHAERQLDYARLSRAQKDEQDKWAAAKGTELAPCPNNWGWLRYHLHPLAGGRKYPGYVCEGGRHYIPDVLVAEGVPGLYSAGPVPWALSDTMRVSPEEDKIPQGYWGPVRPTGQGPDGRTMDLSSLGLTVGMITVQGGLGMGFVSANMAGRYPRPY